MFVMTFSATSRNVWVIFGKEAFGLRFESA
jgi:hypothetical protein